MKILQVNCVYNRGSTGKIVNDIHKGLQEIEIESIVCYGRGPKTHEPHIYKTSSEGMAKLNALRSRITGLQYNGSAIATHRILNIIKRENPDIVHLHCINGYFVNIYKLIEFLKINNINTVLSLHAEFMHTGSCGHAYECNKWMVGCGECPQLWNATKSYFFDRTSRAWRMMESAFEGFNKLKVVAVSEWLKQRAEKSPIMKDLDFKVIGNGIDTEKTFYPHDFRNLKAKYGLSDERVLLHVTAGFSLDEDDIKGGRYIVKLAEKLKRENIKIIIVGSYNLNLTLPENIINVGRVNNQIELARYYSLADLTVLTSKRETYSMVCAESLSCGTPIVGFKAGAPETISLKSYSAFVDYGDINSLDKTIRDWIHVKSHLTSTAISSLAKQTYSKEKMNLEYIKIYTQLYQNIIKES
ncbi:glycosyltransferase [Paenibacillus donghaensis]|nr:glycosyltransferase [Paenibacillus donghaensis]